MLRAVRKAMALLPIAELLIGFFSPPELGTKPCKRERQTCANVEREAGGMAR
ncbi:MAG: hypothetical protein WA354_19435 [Terracidiphilus sp.]